MKAAISKAKGGKPAKPAAKPAKKAPAAKPAQKAPVKSTAKTQATKKIVPKKAAPKSVPRKKTGDTGNVLTELRFLAKELNQAAKDLGKRSAGNPKEVSVILGNVERMTADAANKSLIEAEAAKLALKVVLDSLGKDWSRKEIEGAIKIAGEHLTNIIVAQEFQDLAGQALRKATKALVGAIIVVEGGGPTEDQRLSQKDVDGLLNDLMP